MAEGKENKSRYLIWAVILLAVVALLLAGAYLWQIAPKPYYAVLLANGDLYFGKLTYFPKLTISDPYTLQAVTDPETGEAALQVVPLSVSIWAPEKLVINPDQVVTVSKITKDSQVMRLIEGNSNPQNTQ